MKNFQVIDRLSRATFEDETRPDTTVAMGNAMLGHGLPEPVRTSLLGMVAYGLIILVPTKEHVGVIADALSAMLDEDDVVVGLTRTANGIDARMLTEGLAAGSVVVAVAVSDIHVPASFRALADETVVLEPHDAAIVRKTLQEVYGRRPPALPKGFVVHTNPELVCRCIVRRLPIKKTVAALAKLGDTQRKVVAEPLPPLEECVEFGAAREWGMQVVAELAAWRRGELHASDLETGCLLNGPPGSGKTRFARTLAESMNAPLIEMTAGKLFVDDGHLGDVVGEMRRVFAAATAAAPAVLLIDEIDSFSRRDIADNNRSFNTTVINELLTLLDGASGRHPGLVVVGATNLVDLVEPALLRPGRLSRVIQMTMPNRDGVEHIMRTHLRGDLADEPLDRVVELASGLSPAQLMSAVAAARREARSNDRLLEMGDLLSVLGGGEGDWWPTEPNRIAVHEAGHAIACLLLPGAPYLDSVTVLRRGPILGHARTFEPDGPKTRSQIEQSVMMLLAGGVAEEVVFGAEDLGDGAGIDLREATYMVAKMHGHLGLGTTLTHVDDLGLRLLHDPEFAKTVEDELQRLRKETFDVLNGCCLHLMALSVELDRRKILDGNQVLEVIQQIEARRQEMLKAGMDSERSPETVH